MEVYVLKNGERRGPFSTWRLREMLEEKQLDVTDLGWHVGMENWMPLRQIPALEMWLPRPPAEPPPLPATPEEWRRRADLAMAEARAENERGTRVARAALRLLGRVLDDLLLYLVFWIAGVSAGWLNVWDFGDFRAMSPHWLLLWLIPAAARVPLEAALLRWTGTTPGKWLAGVHVKDDLGQNPSWGAAFKRTALVTVFGAGLGLPLTVLPLGLLPVAQGIAGFIQYRRAGFTLWDRAAGTEVLHRSVSPAAFVSILLILCANAAIYSYLMLAVPLPAHMPEDLRRQIEEKRLELKAARP